MPSKLFFQIKSSLFKLLALVPACAKITEKNAFLNLQLIFGDFSKVHLQTKGGHLMAEDFGLYLSLTKDGYIKRDLTRPAGKVSLENTTIQNELILFSELNFEPYALVVDLVRNCAGSIMVQDEGHYAEYYEWLDAATKARDDYLAGKISKEEVLKTLNLQ